MSYPSALCLDTAVDGDAVVEHPDPGRCGATPPSDLSAVDLGGQARRTQLREDTGTALFINDAIDPHTDSRLRAAADDLVDQLERPGPNPRRMPPTDRPDTCAGDLTC